MVDLQQSFNSIHVQYLGNRVASERDMPWKISLEGVQGFHQECLIGFKRSGGPPAGEKKSEFVWA